MASEIAPRKTEQERASHLLEAQTKAHALFEEISKIIVRPGVSEKQLSDEIHALGEKRHNVRTHWHKRVVRSGPNTLQPYAENPPDRNIEEDDILFVDLGPVFEAWEADFGRTFVVGEDPVKARLRDSLEPTWNKVKAQFDADPDMTGAGLFEIAKKEAKAAGWEFGGPHAGHLVGDFPHERIPNNKTTLYITDGNDDRMRKPGKDGNMRHWILEIHLVDRERQIGGFFEQLLTVN
jgi:Xaa-Pro aminopeptidase